MTRFGKASLLVIPAMAATLLAPLPTRSSAAPRTGCQDLPISYTFLSTTAAPAAIWNDDPTKPYENGSIHRCGSNPTNDATLVLAHSKRSVWIRVPNPFPNSNIVNPPPSFAGGAPFQSQAFFNVRNLLGSKDPYFYTSMASQFPAPDGKTHHLRLLPDAWACPGDLVCVPNIHGGILADSNLPVETSWVRVHYMPPPNPSQPWSLSNTAQWIVDGELADTVYPSLYERATLHNGTHEGQYSMPLQILITALGPL
ncbi:MAG TPA: hypothetical protein VLE22_07430 [Bryobacteraceae bacterium]|nr:hypothetical protein [Bryobacteraceae bacterium]